MTPAALNSDGIASLLLAADELAAVVAGVRYGGLAAPLLARGVHPVALIVARCALSPVLLFAASFALPALAAEPVPAAVVAGVFVFPLIVVEGVLSPAIVFPAAVALPVLVAGSASAPAVAGVFGLALIVSGWALAAVAVCVIVFALPAVVAGHWPVCSFLPMT